MITVDPHITIDRYRLDQLDQLVTLADNPKIAAMLRDRFPSPYTHELGRHWIQANQGEDSPNFAIYLDGNLVGSIGYIPGTDIYAHTAEVGYWLGEPYWGQGIMSKTLRVFSNWLLIEKGFIRLFAGIFQDNPASVRVVEAAGFQYEGIFQYAVQKKGRFKAELRYAKIRNPTGL